MSAVIKLSSPATRDFWEIPVLFEDEHLLALNKPGGLSTSPDRDDPQRPNLSKLLHTGIAELKPWAQQRGLGYLRIAHRLDVDTTGVILLAKSKMVLVQLANSFSSEKPVKKYVALARGTPPEDRIEIDVPLAPHPAKAGLMHVDSKRGKHSHTSVQVLERFSGYALLRCEPLIARPHQIQAHLRHIGLPIAGDSLYGGRPLFLSQLKRDYHAKGNEPERPLIACTALHAEELGLPHPVTGEMLTISAPWPKDLTVAVKYLRRFAGRSDGVRE